MIWHYVLNGSPAGPIDAAELSRKIAEGVITPATLVWQEGMADWIPYSQALTAERPTASGTTCAHCKGVFPPDQLIHLGGSPVCAACKPIVLEKVREGVTTNSAAAQLRTQHLAHEASLRSVGMLFLIGGTVTAVAGIIGVVTPLAMTSSGAPKNISQALLGALMLALGGGQCWAGYLLRRLRPLARAPVGLISGLGLLAIPFGTLINGYILYLLFSRKGRFVLSAEYQAIIAATPEIKYRTSTLAWVVLGVVVLLVGAAIFWGATS